MAAICMLVMCVGSQMIVHASPDQDAAAGALLQELMEHELAKKLGLNADNVGDICPPVCENCLIVCAIKCVLNPKPVACYADCIVKDDCFPKTMVA